MRTQGNRKENLQEIKKIADYQSYQNKAKQVFGLIYQRYLNGEINQDQAKQLLDMQKTQLLSNLQTDVKKPFNVTGRGPNKESVQKSIQEKIKSINIERDYKNLVASDYINQEYISAYDAIMTGKPNMPPAWS